VKITTIQYVTPYYLHYPPLRIRFLIINCIQFETL
jgi:hypothetical protein